MESMKALKWILMSLSGMLFLLIIVIEGYSYYRLSMLAPEKNQTSINYSQSIKDTYWVSLGELGNLQIDSFSVSMYLAKVSVILVSKNGHIDFSSLYSGAILANQLARQLIGTQSLRSVNWHLDNLIITSWVSRNYNADEAIAEVLKSMYFGHSTFGFSQAASFYFDKPVSRLQFSEVVTLIALTYAPPQYSPYCNNVDKLVKRADYIYKKLKAYNPAKYESFTYELPGFKSRVTNC